MAGSVTRWGALYLPLVFSIVVFCNNVGWQLYLLLFCFLVVGELEYETEQNIEVAAFYIQRIVAWGSPDTGGAF